LHCALLLNPPGTVDLDLTPEATSAVRAATSRQTTRHSKTPGRWLRCLGARARLNGDPGGVSRSNQRGTRCDKQSGLLVVARVGKSGTVSDMPIQVVITWAQ